MTPKPEQEQWVIAGEGRVIAGSNAETEKESWKGALRGTDDCYGKILKKELMRDGYRAVRVKLVEVTE